MNSCGGGVLPPNVDSMHLRVLPGPYVLQVDEIINITSPLRGRYEKAPPGVKRCLKLSMTDGVQRVFGMEYRPIQALEVCASSGLKVAISNVHVRRGLLMLVPETIEILGGLVEQLDAARKRLVDEINKPPRGKRTKNGVLPPLATRATLAAWPSSGVDDLACSGSTLHSTDSVPENNQGAGLNMSGSGNSLTTEDTLLVGAQNAASNSMPHIASNAEAVNMDMRRDTNTVSCASPMANQLSSVISRAEEMHINAACSSIPHMATNAEAMDMDIHRDTNPVSRASPMANQLSSVISRAEEMHINAASSSPQMATNSEAMNMDMCRDAIPVSLVSPVANHISSVISRAEEMHIDAANVTRENSIDNQPSHMVSNVAEAHNDAVHITREISVATECSPVVENVEADRDRTHVTTANAHLRRSSTILNTSDVQMVDASDHPQILSGDQEVPFTYIASLSAKWAAMKEKAPFVRGKIKSFLTGVKGFQYKKRTTYELQAYVDDGSLISEILIDHDVVQKGIGYSPEEVTAALSSHDMKIVHQMKDTMRKFQAFLANFEGIILVELNKKSSLPLALEMSQGCPQSDACLLLRRLKSLHSPQVQNNFPSDPIELSP
ncbi:RecQ-mediated instability protein 1 [Spatholobus suberectus]|nr:RecQ-mediated instability protein 1 [Spatholobus suberectus]